VDLLEAVEAKASLQPNGNGGFEYAGGSKMLWDTQIPKKEPDGKETLLCDNDHEWETLRTEGEGEQM